MLIPTFKYLSLPVIALAVIASLPAPAKDEPRQGARQVAAPEIIRTVNSCDGAAGTRACALAANHSIGVVR